MLRRIVFVVGALVCLPSVARADTATSCTADSGLPAPVAQTVVDNARSVQATAATTSGQQVPVDVAGTVASAAGCTNPAPAGTTTTSSTTTTTVPAAGGGTQAAVLGAQVTRGDVMPRTGAPDYVAPAGGLLLAAAGLLRWLVAASRTH